MNALFGFIHAWYFVIIHLSENVWILICVWLEVLTAVFIAVVTKVIIMYCVQS